MCRGCCFDGCSRIQASIRVVRGGGGVELGILLVTRMGGAGMVVTVRVWERRRGGEGCGVNGGLGCLEGGTLLV